MSKQISSHFNHRPARLSHDIPPLTTTPIISQSPHQTILLYLLIKYLLIKING